MFINYATCLDTLNLIYVWSRIYSPDKERFFPERYLKETFLKSSIFWDVKPCSLMKVNRRFGGTCRLYLQSSTLKMEAICSSETSTFNGPHCIVSQNIELFLTTAVRNSNPTKYVSVQLGMLIILSVVSYRCATWSFILMEEHGVCVWEQSDEVN
jgi:hypothetical protein